MSSMLYTMGMALDRAHEHGYTVDVLIEGAWLTGQVVANDGTGVVLECPDLSGAGVGPGHAVVRTERISAVRVAAESPHHVALESGSYPMPGPRGY